LLSSDKSILAEPPCAAPRGRGSDGERLLLVARIRQPDEAGAVGARAEGAEATRARVEGDGDACAR
jgi:hypothetical protein